MSGDENPIVKELVESAFRKLNNDPTLTLSECRVTPLQEGDNYASTMWRVLCTMKSREELCSKELVVKTMPSGEFMVEYVVAQRCFEKEVKMLQEVVPALEKMLALAGDALPLGPKFYYSEAAPNPVIIMEDLCADKFKIGDSVQGLNLEQCLQVVKSLAAFHVTSMVLLEQRPDLREFFTLGYWGASNRKTTSLWLTDSLKKITDRIDDWSSYQWSSHLQLFQERIPDELYALYDAKDTDVPQVLNHVDIKTNNIMFRYRGCGLYDLRFIDLQLCAARSPVFDLLYFIFSSPRNEIRITEMDTLLRAYYRRWVHVCQLLGHPVDFTFDNLMMDFKKKLLFGFVILYALYPMVSVPKEEALYGKQGVDESGDRIYENKRIREGILQGLKYFKAQELFET